MIHPDLLVTSRTFTGKSARYSGFTPSAISFFDLPGSCRQPAVSILSLCSSCFQDHIPFRPDENASQPTKRGAKPLWAMAN
jgi:hypothetical protein